MDMASKLFGHQAPVSLVFQVTGQMESVQNVTLESSGQGLEGPAMSATQAGTQRSPELQLAWNALQAATQRPWELPLTRHA